MPRCGVIGQRLWTSLWLQISNIKLITHKFTEINCYWQCRKTQNFMPNFTVPFSPLWDEVPSQGHNNRVDKVEQYSELSFSLHLWPYIYIGGNCKYCDYIVHIYIHLVVSIFPYQYTKFCLILLMDIPISFNRTII